MDAFYDRKPAVPKSLASSSASQGTSSASQRTSASVESSLTAIDVIWSHFRDVTRMPNNAFTVTCTFCNQKFQSLKAHRAKHHIYGPTGTGICVCPSQSPALLELGKLAKPVAPTVAIRQTKDTNYFRNLSLADRKKSVDDAVAKFFYANAIPFNASDSVEYKEMCVALQNQPPAYHPPQRKALSTTLLKRAKQHIISNLDKIVKIMEVTGATMCSDGWTNGAQDSLYNVMFMTPSGALFKEMIIGTAERKTAIWLAKRWTDVINAFPYDVVCLCTDNAEVCKAAGKIIMGEFPHIIWVGCAAHSIDLLLKDASKHPFAEDIIAEIKKVRLKCFSSLVRLCIFEMCST